MNIESELSYSSVLHFLVGLIAGLGALCILSQLVTCIVNRLQRKGGLEAQVKKERNAGLRFAESFGRVEQTLFFLARIAGPDFFKWAVGGWLVLKAIHNWRLWDPEDVNEIPDSAKRAGMSKDHYHAAIGRNRFLVFLAGTGLSIAAGGVAGEIFHLVMRILD